VIVAYLPSTAVRVVYLPQTVSYLPQYHASRIMA